MSRKALGRYVSSVKIRLGTLRKLIREATLGKPYIHNSMSPDTANREQIGSLNDLDIDTEQFDDVAPHLRDVVVTPEECFGPVPPTVDGVARGSIDPYVQDSGFAPYFRRGKPTESGGH